MIIWNHTIIYIMNLLARARTGLILLILALFFIACEDPGEIGLELTGDPERIGAFYQELELESTLINNDSLFTLSVVRLLSGKTYNPEFGELTSTSYTQFGYSSEAPDIPENAIYDSLVMDIKSDYSFGGGNGSTQRFTVHELLEDLYDTAEYYSFSSVEFDPLPLSAGDFMLTEKHDTILSFRIDDAFGQRLFEAAKDTNAVDPDDVHTLYNLFKGFAIISDEGNNAVLGINVLNDSTALRLFYTVDTTAYNYPFSFEDVANFNQFVTNRAGTPLQGIEGLYYQDFVPENGKAYIQSGADLVTKIDLMPLLEFFDTLDNVTINQALMNITIDEPAYNELTPSSVSFYYTDETNKRLVLPGGGGYLGIRQEGTTDLLRAPFNTEDLSYVAPITLFLDNLINGGHNYDVLLMYPPDFGIANTVNQCLVSQGKIELQIYYSRVK